MSWNYRVIETEGGFAIHEVFYDEDGSIEGWTEDAVGPRGETVEEFREDLVRYVAALEKPILSEDETGRLRERA